MIGQSVWYPNVYMHLRNPGGSKVNRARIGLVATILLLCSLTPVSAQSVPTVWTEDQVQKILSSRIDVDKEAVGIVVGLIDMSGPRVFAHGAKSANEPTAKLDGNTVFEIGSVSKAFTSLLLADMVQKGEVALDDPVSKYLPKTVTLPMRGKKEITLLDLATHTSGLPRMPSNHNPADPANPYADYTVDSLYSFLSESKLTRAIGSKYEYSNLGAGLLGHVLALRAGTSYENLMIDRIAKPLGMTSTSIQLSADKQRRMAKGHDQTLAEVKNWDIPTLAGAGAIRSTVNDMLLFLEANMGKKESALQAAMTEQQKTRKPTDSPELSMCLGWHKFNKFGEEFVWHNGQTGGFHSFIGFDKKRGVGVVLLCNTGAEVDDIGFHLIDNRWPLKKPAMKLDPKILESYVGNYELNPSFVISITKFGDKMMLQATGQQKIEIFPESETKFFLKVVDAQVSFETGDNGAVTHLILHQNGLNQKGKRK